MTTATKRPTWRDLLAIEPRLGILEAHAMELARKPDAEWRGWERLIKADLKRLVGDFADTDDELLGSRDAWDVAHDHLLACFEGAIR